MMMKNISEEMPVITSGMISGAVTRPDITRRPRNLVKRASAMPAMVPRMVATQADTKAISSDRMSASITCLLENSETYHLVEKPPQTLASRDSLKE